MLKWVIGLCALMYLALITIGEPTEEEIAARAERDAILAARTITPTSTPEPATGSVVAVSAPASAVETAPAVVQAAVTEEITAPALVSVTTDTTTPAAAEPVATQEIAPVTATEPATIRRVTGRRVNLRAGPSTTTEIVGRAVRDDSAEIVEMLPSGWAKVYILETGIEAYISAQFLSDAG